MNTLSQTFCLLPMKVHYSTGQSSNPNCKSIGEICGDKVKQEQGCVPTNCPKNQRTSCYPERPKCGEIKGTGKKPIIESVETYVHEKIDYTKLKCPTPKFEKLCPCPSPAANDYHEEENDDEKAKRLLAELPKPPTGPVILCQCAPPPKLPPGACPCASATRDTQSADPTIPCAPKTKYHCPEQRIFYCPPRVSARVTSSGQNIVK